MSALVTLLFHDVWLQSADESGYRGAGANRYKLTLAQLQAQLAAVRAVRDDKPVLVTVLADKGTTAETAALPTFAISADDGGISYHSLLAPCLDNHGWRGHCLITTGRIGRPGFLHKHHVRELHAAGHLIGTHSVSHAPHFDTCSAQQLLAEWSRSKATLEDIIGAPVLVGSIPGGYYARRVVQAAHEAGLHYLFTSEPEQAPHQVDGCEVRGRFTLRRDSPADLAGRFVSLTPGARWQQWLAWNAKKALKKTLGPGYLQLADWLARKPSR